MNNILQWLSDEESEELRRIINSDGSNVVKAV
jgi:hypothetical protein